MKPQMRRILAFVVARLVAQIDSNTLYDYQEISYFNYLGTIENDLIRVHDNKGSIHLNGSATINVDKKLIVKLNDPVNITNIEISIELDKEKEDLYLFSGRGRGHFLNFHGTVDKSGKVSFYDSSTGMYYKLKI